MNSISDAQRSVLNCLDYEVNYRIALLCIGDYRLNPEHYYDKPSRLKRLRGMLKNDGPKDRLQRRADLKARLNELQRDGMVPVYVWHRDCDQCEGDSVTLVPANVIAYNRFEDRQFRYAEGPMQVYPISFDEYEEFTPYSRDRRAEQYNY